MVCLKIYPHIPLAKTVLNRGCMQKRDLKLILITILTICNLFIFSSKSISNALDFSAKAYILYCPENRQIILEKSSNEKLPIASTTKIMTSLIALETAKIKDEDVVVTSDMLKAEGSSMGLNVGDVLPLSSLAKGMLTVSGNDAANSVALSLCSSLESFSKLMNKKAKELGMKNSNFVTPSGLDAKDHYSTAYDLALLASSAMNNEDFLKVASKTKTDVMFKNPKKVSIFYNENKLLKKYKGCIGGKTGYTKLSGRCLVSCAQRDNLRLVAVTLNAPDDWNDHIKLFDYGFSNFKASIPKDEDIKIPLLHGIDKYVNLETIKTQSFEFANLTMDEASHGVTVDGKEYAKCNLTPTKDYDEKNNKRKIWKKFTLFVKRTYCAITNFFRKIINFPFKLFRRISR